MLVDGPNEVYMVDRDNTVFHVPNLQVRHTDGVVFVVVCVWGGLFHFGPTLWPQID